MAATSEGVTIELDGSPATLRYSLGASKKVDAYFGDFVQAYKRVSSVNFAACAFVVAAATDQEVAAVEAAVFRAGVASLAPQVAEYLTWLSNGGRDPSIKPAKDAENDSGNG